MGVVIHRWGVCRSGNSGSTFEGCTCNGLSITLQTLMRFPYPRLAQTKNNIYFSFSFNLTPGRKKLFIYQKPEVYGDAAQFTKEGDKFTALLLGFPLHKIKGGGYEREFQEI